ncbi:FGFR1 oncogene partner isoform X3 [Triplophysa rosa]|uniref:Centrosomal protein 43 n=1 Tax=Triplophysa rosa TaxID=992332 RepID=A0A9W7TNH8_TRIRA|nr:FGFR1 oncogene partner isoform X3 [Triplophysa rosa]KAI7799641.1 putative FGFR1 oncogene partner [Triplophysa rosa]
MSATEEDTELRDLLIQNLENSGVLNKIKAELRSAVFLALEEQDKVENKTPLVNENLKKSLNTKDGRLVAGLITDFLQVFNLDFTLAVFQPEINTLNGLETRESLSKELSISESEVNRNTPLLLELVKRSRQKTSIFGEGDKVTEKSFPKELSPRQIADARKKFDSYDKNRSGEIPRDSIVAVFSDLFPHFCRNVLESYINEELKDKSRDTCTSIDFQDFLGMYKCFFIQCRSVVTNDSSDAPYFSSKTIEDRIMSSSASKIPRYKGFVKHSSAQDENADPKAADRRHETLGSLKNIGSIQVSDGSERGPGDGKNASIPLRRTLELGLEDEDEEGDSFFDDPLPKPQKTYGCRLPSADKPYSGLRLSEKTFGQKDLSAIGSDKEGDGEDFENRPSPDSEPRRETSGSISGKALSMDAQLKSAGGSVSADSSQKDPASDKNDHSSSKEKGVKNLQVPNENSGSPLLDAVCTDEVLDYDDDFNSHRSENSKSEVSIDEEIEEVSIEGPDISDKLDESTQDVSVSQISLDADYMEDVA